MPKRHDAPLLPPRRGNNREQCFFAGLARDHRERRRAKRTHAAGHAARADFAHVFEQRGAVRVVRGGGENADGAEREDEQRNGGKLHFAESWNGQKSVVSCEKRRARKERIFVAQATQHSLDSRISTLTISPLST